MGKGSRYTTDCLQVVLTRLCGIVVSAILVCRTAVRVRVRYSSTAVAVPCFLFLVLTNTEAFPSRAETTGRSAGGGGGGGPKTKGTKRNGGQTRQPKTVVVVNNYLRYVPYVHMYSSDRGLVRPYVRISTSSSRRFFFCRLGHSVTHLTPSYPSLPPPADELFRLSRQPACKAEPKRPIQINDQSHTPHHRNKQSIRVRSSSKQRRYAE